jgi:hypothetical protein
MSKTILTELIGVRFDQTTYKLIQKVAAAQGIGACDFVRRSVKRELARLSFLPDEEKKALEIEVNETK